MDYREIIRNYIPFNEQEKKDKEVMLKYIEKFPDILSRSNDFAHFTASSWCMNESKTKVIMVYHNIFKSWTVTGGHADENPNLLEVAIRELQEESGLRQVKILREEPISIEAMGIKGHFKNGKYVNSHLHLNVNFLLEGKEEERLQIKEDENSGVQWVPIEKVLEYSTEDWVKEYYYKKLFQKLEIWKNK